MEWALPFLADRNIQQVALPAVGVAIEGNIKTEIEDGLDSQKIDTNGKRIGSAFLEKALLKRSLCGWRSTDTGDQSRSGKAGVPHS